MSLEVHIVPDLPNKKDSIVLINDGVLREGMYLGNNQVLLSGYPRMIELEDGDKWISMFEVKKYLKNLTIKLLNVDLGS